VVIEACSQQAQRLRASRGVTVRFERGSGVLAGRKRTYERVARVFAALPGYVQNIMGAAATVTKWHWAALCKHGERKRHPFNRVSSCRMSRGY